MGVSGFATHFVGEIAAVTNDGGRTLLRETVAALDEDQREMLREALDAAPASLG